MILRTLWFAVIIVWAWFLTDVYQKQAHKAPKPKATTEVRNVALELDAQNAPLTFRSRIYGKAAQGSSEETPRATEDSEQAVMMYLLYLLIMQSLQEDQPVIEDGPATPAMVDI